MRLLALVVCVALSGCAAVTPDWHVRIDSWYDGRHAYGHGILVDSTHVLTVQHVAPGPRDYKVSRANLHGTRREDVIRHVEAYYQGGYTQGSVEAFSVLRLRKPMFCEEWPELRSIEPGDSGGPILGKRGAVVGLITGYSVGVFSPGRTLLGTNGPRGPVPRIFPRRKPE